MSAPDSKRELICQSLAQIGGEIAAHTDLFIHRTFVIADLA
jgi:hypothetical protein